MTALRGVKHKFPVSFVAANDEASSHAPVGSAHTEIPAPISKDRSPPGRGAPCAQPVSASDAIPAPIRPAPPLSAAADGQPSIPSFDAGGGKNAEVSASAERVADEASTYAAKSEHAVTNSIPQPSVPMPSADKTETVHPKPVSVALICEVA